MLIFVKDTESNLSNESTGFFEATLSQTLKLSFSSITAFRDWWFSSPNQTKSQIIYYFKLFYYLKQLVINHLFRATENALEVEALPMNHYEVPCKTIFPNLFLFLLKIHIGCEGILRIERLTEDLILFIQIIFNNN